MDAQVLWACQGGAVGTTAKGPTLQSWSPAATQGCLDRCPDKSRNALDRPRREAPSNIGRRALNAARNFFC